MGLDCGSDGELKLFDDLKVFERKIMGRFLRYG